jgi:hypothetical protein
VQGTVAALLLVTSAVILTSVVVDFAVVVSEQALQTTSPPQLDRIRSLESMLLNQTERLLNQTQALPTDPAQP